MFYALFTQPLLNALAFFVWLSPGNSLAVAIILLTVTLRAVLYPFQRASTRSQETLKRLQPKLEEIKKKYAGLREKQLEATMALYREERVNPLVTLGTNLLLLGIQLPILIALFTILSNDTAAKLFNGLYGFTPRPDSLEASVWGLFNLTQPNIVMAAVAGLAQFVQMRLAAKKMAGGATEGFAAAFQKQSQFLFPVLTVVIAMRLPSALALYWTVFTLTALADDVWRLLKEKRASP